MRKPRLLVVDDEPAIVASEREILEDHGYAVETATSAAAARQKLTGSFFDLLVLDERIHGSSGTELFAESRARYPGIGAIFVTGYADLACAVRALRAGALDLLQKPIDRPALLAAVDRALTESALTREHRFHWRDVHARTDFSQIVGDSPALRKTLALVQHVIRTDAVVLLEGESGTGKELVARAIHSSGARQRKPFIAINAAAVPGSLTESTLFGHRKGAFTDAHEDRPGMFEAAQGGTVFLDEVGDMTPEVQVRLLRVLQERTVVRVGDTAEIPVDVRIIAATNRNLRAEVDAHRFREDLFYRLAVFPLRLPPLRERLADIRPLTMHLIKKNSVQLKKYVTGISQTALEALEKYAWPGNIRELDNVLQRAIILTGKEVIDVEDVLLERRSEHANDVNCGSHLLYKEARSAFERRYFTKLLERTNGNVSEAARVAGLNRTAIYDHLKKIDEERST